jgi:uncharacterized protein (TIGR02271 family)
MRPQGIHEGQKVLSRDGEKLGKIIACGASTFLIEKGLILTKELSASYDDIAGMSGDDVLLRLSKDEILARSRADEAAVGTRAETTAPSTMATETTRVPLVEEELTAEKRTEKAGDVRVRKEVRTEQQTVTVPVTKEQVIVERVPAEAGAQVPAGAFEKGEVTIPIHEEKVDVQKRPVVREEVRVTKEARQTEQRVSGEVKKEEADIESTDEVVRYDSEHRPST